MKHTQKKYDTSQEIFYTVCDAGWNLCTQYLADFAKLKAFYTQEYINNARETLKAAKECDSSNSGIQNIKQLRIKMVKAAREVQYKWQTLKLYINAAYAPQFAEINLTAAGARLYKKSSADNWGSMFALTDAAQVFMRGHFDELTARQNMPADFPADFKAVANRFLVIATEFFKAKTDSGLITYSKLQANNIVYDALISMLKDAQVIFHYRPEIKKQFVFSNMVAAYEKKNTAKKNTARAGTRPVFNVTIISNDAELSEMKNVA